MSYFVEKALVICLERWMSGEQNRDIPSPVRIIHESTKGAQKMFKIFDRFCNASDESSNKPFYTILQEHHK